MTQEEVRIADAFDAAVWWARHLLALPAEQWVICDTETTALDGECIQVAIIAGDGTVLLDTLIRPLGAVSPSAYAIHHISDDDLRTAPPFPACYAAMKTALSQRKVICYNSDFDTQILNGDCQRHGLPLLFAGWGVEGVVPSRAVADAMQYYARYVGMWSTQYHSFRWPSLPGAGHTALADCYAVLELITMMAADTRTGR